MTSNDIALPPIAARADFELELERIRAQEKQHTRAGDALAAARRRLPMVEVDPLTPLTGANGPTTLLEAFEGRRQLLVYYFMWNEGGDHADQCDGCTYYTNQIGDLSYLHARDITFAVFAQGPWDESVRYREFMGWRMPWYSARQSVDRLLVGRTVGMMHLVSYVRDGDQVFETYWTTLRGVEAMDNTYRLMDLTAYGRQEPHEDSPDGWPQTSDNLRDDTGRPLAQVAHLDPSGGADR